MKVLFAASEAVPYAKSGGLADVMGSLPAALVGMDVDARVVIPRYGSIPGELRKEIRHLKTIFVKVGWRNQYCGIQMSKYKGVTFYFIDNEYYFKRDGLYGHGDEAERFAFFSRAVLDCLPHIDFVPDIIHLNDWQTGMIPVFLNQWYRDMPFYKNIKTIFTIHNLQYQGIFPKEVLSDILGLGEEFYTFERLEYNGCINYMKGGLVFSDMLTTVSPSYANEILTPYYGEGLNGVLNKRKNDLRGILNGIDYDEYNPKTDDYLPAKGFSNIDSWSYVSKAKAENKMAFQQRMHMPIRPDVPAIGIITRLVAQKGLDLISCVLNELLEMDIQIWVLGTGEKHFEEMFKYAADRNPERINANIMFDNKIAHQIYAGADMFLMPSHFEPCGLGQMIALRYGTIPIVRETGGLKDSVVSYNEYEDTGNGFSFANYNAHDMLFTIRRAIDYYYKKDTWEGLVKRAMSQDFSWKNSAIKYKDLYAELKG